MQVLLLYSYMNVRYIVYYCLDAIKAISKDSSVTEEHILYLLDKYRSALLKKYSESKTKLSEENYQVICLNLEPNIQRCDEYVTLKSKEKIPTVLGTVPTTILSENGMESENIVVVPIKRLKAVGYNKWGKHFLYCAIGPDNYLYVRTSNHQGLYLKKLRMKAVFEDYESASQLNCEGTNQACDVMDRDFPIETALVPELIAYIIKEGLGIIYRPKDDVNNASDDLADLMLFIKRNMKKPLQKQIEGIDE